MLSKHPGLCRYPHGHSRQIDVIIEADALDASDMVCDFKTIKLALGDFVQKLDHAMAINSADPMHPVLASSNQRLVVFDNLDPTTEVMAERIFRFLSAELSAGKSYTDDRGHTYRFPKGLRLQRVRVSETATTWAEFSA